MSAKMSKTKPTVLRNNPNEPLNDGQKVKSIPSAALKSKPPQMRETKVAQPKQNSVENKTENVKNEQPMGRNQVVETGTNSALILNIETYDNAPSNICYVNLPENTAAYVKIKALATNVDDGESVSVTCKSFTFKNTTKNGIQISKPYGIISESDNFSGDYIFTIHDSEIVGNENSPSKTIKQIGVSVVGTNARIRWLVSFFIMKVELTPMNLPVVPQVEL